VRKIFALALTTGVLSFGGTISIGTGTADWQVEGPGVPGTIKATALTTGETNGAWAPAPTGSSWLSWRAVEGTSCVVGQTPGNGCADTNFNPTSGDLWLYTLTVSAATLGVTSGTANFVFGADSSLKLFIGNELAELWGQSGGGFATLGCSNESGVTSAGNTQGSYSGCTTTASFNAADLNGDGSLTISAFVTNAPIGGCPACGNPTGFVLGGEILTGASTVAPEPGTFGLMGVAGLALLGIRRRR
jgi:hypothetical protein